MMRPPANAFDPELVGDLIEVLTSLEDALPRAVVLTGSGGFFSGGADLRVVPALTPEGQADMARGMNRVFAGWHTFPRPVVCAVSGHAVAGGLVLALCGDYRVVSMSGRFGLTEVKVGIPYPSAAMTVVKAELIAPVARRLVLRGELLDAPTCVDLQVFDEVLPDDAVLARSIAMAAELAELPPVTYGLVKQRLRSEHGRPEMLAGAAATAEAMAEAPEAARRVLEGDHSDR
jgi:enoyl-CoA hydratase